MVFINYKYLYYTFKLTCVTSRVPSPLLNEVVKIAIDLESNAAEAHYRTAME